MNEDDKIYVSKIHNPEEFGDFSFTEYEPCGCGKNLEQALALDRTTMVHLSFRDNELHQRVVCHDCARKSPEPTDFGKLPLYWDGDEEGK